MNNLNPTDDCTGGGSAKATATESAFASIQAAESPQLVKKGRVTVIRGGFPEGFTWDAFLDEEQNERLRQIIGCADRQKT